jgi:acetyl-CoA carboxylase beta subunit
VICSCGSQFSSEQELLEHLESHRIDEVLYKCPECKKLLGKLDILRHMKFSGEIRYKCSNDRCARLEFNTADKLNKHIQDERLNKAHDIEGYSCQCCQRSFGIQQKSKNHERRCKSTRTI